jgi:hypothetical protein
MSAQYDDTRKCMSGSRGLEMDEQIYLTKGATPGTAATDDIMKMKAVIYEKR